MKLKYKGQLIRRSNEPYFNHLNFVAKLAEKAIPFGFEIGICHDLLEDTETTSAELQSELLGFGYAIEDAVFITGCVVELTDVFTKKMYPSTPKSIRKEKEAARLSSISATAQTVKYADLLYNVGWTLEYDQKKALGYLQRKEMLLLKMNKGNRKLWKKLFEIITEAIKTLGN